MVVDKAFIFYMCNPYDLTFPLIGSIIFDPSVVDLDIEV
jgi:hypothetical protein